MAEPRVRIRLDLEGQSRVRRGLDRLRGSVRSLGSSLRSLPGIGATVLSLAGLSRAISGIFRASAEQEASLQALASRLRASGDAAGYSASQLAEYAAQLQSVTTYGDEEILRAQSVLATFHSITGENFLRTTELALDLSTVFGRDLQSSVVQLGKALHDPIRGMQALRESGISLTEQEGLIRSFEAVGDRARAQGVILDEVSRQVGRAARDARNTVRGAWTALGKAWGDLLEGSAEDTAQLRESIEDLTDTLTDPRVQSGFRDLVGLALDFGGAALSAAAAAGRWATSLRTAIDDAPGVAGAREAALRSRIERAEASREALLSGRHGPTQSAFVRAALDLLESRLAELRAKLADAVRAQRQEQLVSPLPALERRFAAPVAAPSGSGPASTPAIEERTPLPPYVSPIDTLAAQAAVEAEQRKSRILDLRDRVEASYAREQALAAAAARADRDRERTARDYAQTLLRARDAAADELRLTERTVYERELLTAAASAGIEERIGADQTFASWLADRSQLERELLDVLAQQLELRRQEIDLLQRAEDLERSESPLDGIREGLTRVTESVESGASRWAEIVQSAAYSMERSLTEFITRGKTDWQGLVDSMIQEAARLAIVQPLIRGLAGALLGWLAPPAVAATGLSTVQHQALRYHDGGIAGVGPHRVPRYHTGGLASDEVPAILQRGEGVFTPRQMAALAPAGSGPPVEVTVQVVNRSGRPLAAQPAGQRVDGRRMILGVVLDEMEPGGAVARALRQNFGVRPSAA